MSKFETKINSGLFEYHCNKCNSCNVQVLEQAWFNPNDSYEFIESVEATFHSREWCNDCNEETTLELKEVSDE
tara:strand:- start:72 stop:290 length:219 start_codon:yes stop_codon:yes gene_type:complete